MKFGIHGLITAAALAVAGPSLAAGESGIDRSLLDGLLRVRSVKGDTRKLNAANDLVRAWLEARGVFCTTETNKLGKTALWASTVRGKSADYLFVSHVDIVPAPDAMFTPRYEGDRFFARGACDTKGNVVAICQTLANLVGKGVSVAAFFATDEEGGSGDFGTPKLMIDLGYRGTKLILVADTAGEAPGQLFVAEKGHIGFQLIAKGKGGHSSRPWALDNPIPRLCEGYLKFKRAWEAQQPACEGTWKTVISPTMLKGGSAGNIIPDAAVMTLSCRFVVPEDKDRVEKVLKEASGLEVFTPARWRAPVVNRPGDPEIAALLKAMNEGIPGGMREGRMSAATDASYFTALGVPTVIYTAEGGEPHSDREWGSLKSLDAYARFFTDYLSTKGVK